VNFAHPAHSNYTDTDCTCHCDTSDVVKTNVTPFSVAD
jgi:hypothetical protein